MKGVSQNCAYMHVCNTLFGFGASWLDRNKRDEPMFISILAQVYSSLRSGAKDPYYGDCTAYAANVGWCGKYGNDDFSPIRCVVHVAAVANTGLPRQHRQWHQWPHLRWQQRQHCNKRVRITQIRIGGSRRPTGRSDADGHSGTESFHT